VKKVVEVKKLKFLIDIKQFKNIKKYFADSWRPPPGRKKSVSKILVSCN